MPSPTESESFLVWGTSPEFAELLTPMLTASGTAWALMSDLSELNTPYRPPYTAVLLDGSQPVYANRILWLREHNRWSDLGVIVVGGESRGDLWFHEHFKQIDIPADAQALHRALEATAVEYQATDTQAALERRNSFRQVCDRSAIAHLDIGVRDLSEGGAQLECDFPITVGTVLRLDLSSTHRELIGEFRFEVLQCRVCKTHTGSYRLHGKFLELTRGDQRRLRKAIFHLQSQVAKGVKEVIET